MKFELVEIVPKSLFLIYDSDGQEIPLSGASDVESLVLEIQHKFRINPHGIRFARIEVDRNPVVIGVMPEYVRELIKV